MCSLSCSTEEERPPSATAPAGSRTSHLVQRVGLFLYALGLGERQAAPVRSDLRRLPSRLHHLLPNVRPGFRFGQSGCSDRLAGGAGGAPGERRFRFAGNGIEVEVAEAPRSAAGRDRGGAWRNASGPAMAEQPGLRERAASSIAAACSGSEGNCSAHPTMRGSRSCVANIKRKYWISRRLARTAMPTRRRGSSGASCAASSISTRCSPRRRSLFSAVGRARRASPGEQCESSCRRSHRCT